MKNTSKIDGSVKLQDKLDDPSFNNITISNMKISGFGVTPTTITEAELKQGIDIFIPFGETAKVQFTVKFNDKIAKVIKNTAELTPPKSGIQFICTDEIGTPKPVQKTCEDDVIIESKPIFSIDKVSDKNSVSINEFINYSIKVKNESIADGRVIVQDLINDKDISNISEITVIRSNELITPKVITVDELKAGVEFLIPANESIVIKYSVKVIEKDNSDMKVDNIATISPIGEAICKDDICEAKTSAVITKIINITETGISSIFSMIIIITVLILLRRKKIK